jgi:hypothetical protein
LTIKNVDGSSQGVTVQFYDGSNARQMWAGVLEPGESLQFTWEHAFVKLDADGVPFRQSVLMAGTMTVDDVIAVGLLL